MRSIYLIAILNGLCSGKSSPSPAPNRPDVDPALSELTSNAALQESLPKRQSSSSGISVDWLFPTTTTASSFDTNSESNATLAFNISSAQSVSQISLILCQLSNPGPTQSYVEIDEIVDLCLQTDGVGCGASTLPSSEANSVLELPVALEPANLDLSTFNLTTFAESAVNFFYCISAGDTSVDTTCLPNSYSPLFSFNDEVVSANVQTLLPTASALILSTTSSIIVNKKSYISTTASSSQTTTSTSVASTSAAISTATGLATSFITVSSTTTFSTPIPTPAATDLSSISSPSITPTHSLTTTTKIILSLSIPLAFLLLITLYLLIRRRKLLNQPKNKTNSIPYPRVAELALGDYSEKAELSAVEKPGELETNGWNWLAKEKHDGKRVEVWELDGSPSSEVGLTWGKEADG